jgi:starvation-inducible DNA-binding protein
MSNFGLKTNEINLSVKILSDLLNEEFTLFSNILNVHWNIEGQNFIAIHKLLEEHYEYVKESCDSLAERIRVFGIKTPANESMNNKNAKINSLSEHSTVNEFVLNLSGDYENVICFIRNSLKELSESMDFGSRALLEEQLQSFEKRHWKLISNL